MLLNSCPPISNLFESPLDFVSGKSCSSVCGSTWDFICYIENFCVANLLKMATVLVLSYIASAEFHGHAWFPGLFLGVLLHFLVGQVNKTQKNKSQKEH
ncbi:hypothetical protein Q3G72_012047 [Acer saccharum]|nr:hypothetical protein Q3G72_012047 [Acer saccharum]